MSVDHIDNAKSWLGIKAANVIFVPTAALAASDEKGLESA
jgi:hypothetical protein